MPLNRYISEFRILEVDLRTSPRSPEASPEAGPEASSEAGPEASSEAGSQISQILVIIYKS